ncbi:MAG: histidine phosphatase family protein [Clostridia bacterium]|nr:histidine phosphatase family protein [Clostridia bacterium]
MRIYMVRHGQSVGNEQRLFFGHSDYPLTPMGEDQALAVALKLSQRPEFNIKRCYSSDLIRAYRTAEIITKALTIPIIKEPGLREQHMGALEGLTFDEAMLRYPDNVKAMLKDWTKASGIEGGETYSDMKVRAMSVIERLIIQDENILIVSHSGAMRAILTGLLDAPNELGNKFYFEHGKYSVIETNKDGACMLRAYNV